MKQMRDAASPRPNTGRKLKVYPAPATTKHYTVAYTKIKDVVARVIICHSPGAEIEDHWACKLTRTVHWLTEY